MINITYELDPIILEIGIRLTNFVKFEGLIGLNYCLEIYKDKISDLNYEYFNCGIQLIMAGVLPEIIELNMQVKRFLILKNEILSDSKLLEIVTIEKFVIWIQNGNLDLFNAYLQFYPNTEAKSLIYTWSYFNRFDSKLNIEEANNLSYEETKKLIELKPERQFKDYV